MIADWPRAFAHLGKHLRSIASGRFWWRAAQVFLRCAPKPMVMTDRNGSLVEVLSPAPLTQPGGENLEARPTSPVFPFAEYRAAMDSGVAAKSTWVHRMKVWRPDASDFEILVLHRIPVPQVVTARSGCRAH